VGAFLVPNSPLIDRDVCYTPLSDDCTHAPSSSRLPWIHSRFVWTSCKPSVRVCSFIPLILLLRLLLP
jgi:hypothetical protein